MSKSLQNILGHMPLTEALRATMSGVPNPLPQEFFNVSPSNRILGDRAQYIRITGERRTAKLAKYGAPPVRRSLKDISEQKVRMMHTFEEIQIDPLVLQQLRSFERYEQDKGMDWLSYQIEENARRQMNTRIISTGSVLRQGTINWDAAGNLLPTASGAAETYSFNVPASHQNQLGGIISSSWASVNTDIPGQINAMMQTAARETGIMPTTALYGINVSRYIRQNDFVVDFLSRNATLNDKLSLGREIPDGLFGIQKWIPMYTSFYETDDIGTTAQVWDDDLIVFCPDISQPNKMTWWAMYEGSYQVPRSMNVTTDAMAALNNFETVYGAFSFASISLKPPGIEAAFGDVWLPGLRNEKAIWQAQVAF